MRTATTLTFRASPPGVMLESVVPLEVRRLAVTPACPVYFWSVETLTVRVRDAAHEVYLKDGVYLSTSKQPNREAEYVVVTGKTAARVTESAALPSSALSSCSRH